ncbi:MAG: metallophosphoesterase [Clostridiales bacterium]|nr:metallophosphoesterase [Clostridiales bacterium]
MEIKTYEITTEKLKKEERPLRLVMLSDLHDRLWGKGQESLLDAIDGLSGDMILCAGDMLVGHEDARMTHAIELFEGLSGRNIPVIASNGNHESRMRQQPGVYGRQYQHYTDRLRKLGVRVLENETLVTQFGSVEIWIHGYELPLKYYRKFNMLPYDEADLQEKFGMVRDDAYHILLSHNPVYFKTYARWGADLTLSGHLHGGIIRLPGIGGVITPQAKLFPRYDRGLFEEEGKYMVVSAGLGEHTIPIRICNPPQLVCIVIKGIG